VVGELQPDRDGRHLNNLSGGVIEAQNDRAIYYYSGSLGLVHNAGLFRKLGGSGVTSVNSIPFENAGTVDVQSGSVLFACPYPQTGGRLNLGLNSLADFGRVQFAGTAPLTGTLSANLNDGFRPRTGDAFPVVTYLAWTGAFTDVALPSVAAWVTNDTIYGASAVTLTVLNAQPVLAAIDDRSLDEETSLNVSSTVDHPDLGQTVSYRLIQAPAGAQIGSATGNLTWTPTEAQAPSLTITIQVIDNVIPPKSDGKLSSMLMRKVNQPHKWTSVRRR
jgi:hypothetical protein